MNMPEFATKVARAMQSGMYTLDAKASWAGYALIRKHGEDRDYGIGFSINLADPNAKVRISGTMPVSMDKNTHGTSPSIGVSRDKSPDKIVDDIERRLLPVYRKVFKENVVSRNARDDHDRIVAGTRQRYVDLAHDLGDNKADLPERSDSEVNITSGKFGYVRRWQVGKENVDIEIGSVPHQLAEDILTLILSYGK